MKTKKMAETVEVEVLEPDEVNFGEVLVVGGDAAERIRRHILAANVLGRMSLAHGVVAGWELARQKAQLGWGGWRAWCQTSLGFSYKTADNYIALCMRTLGAAREAARIPLESAIREDEIEAATAEVADKTASAAMIAFGIVKRNPKHGGAREGAGRKTKDAATEVAEAAKDPDLNWAEVSGYLKGLHDFGVGEDGFGTLADDDLENLVVMLGEIEARAKALLAARRGKFGKSYEMNTNEIVSIVERGL